MVWSQAFTLTGEQVYLLDSLFFIILTSKPNSKSLSTSLKKDVFTVVYCLDTSSLNSQYYVFSYCFFNFIANFNGQFIYISSSKVFVRLCPKINIP